AEEYQDLQKRQPRRIGNEVYPSLEDAIEVANAILHLDPSANGELAYRGFKIKEHKTGLLLADLAEGVREVKYTFADLVAQPRRVLTSPMWSGIVNKGQAYSPFMQNTQKLIPWRTLTGRQHFYLDHENYL